MVSFPRGGAPPRRALLRLPRSLSGRLIAGLIALLAVAAASVGVVTYLAFQHAVADEMNNQLQAATSLTNTCLDHWFTGGDDEGQSGQPSPPGPGNGTPLTSYYCTGLDSGTLVAYFRHDQWGAYLVPHELKLSAADKATLDSIPPSQNPAPGGPAAPPCTRDLPSIGGTYALTAVRDPNGIYVTGLPLSGVHDLLKDVALVEAGVFGAVLLLAGVVGTFWVRLSLRPLRRVASTASEVAELPLESGEVELPRGVRITDPATETGQLGLAFNSMLGHVESALRRRAASEARLRRFAADASHELRTPLAAIRGYAELGLLHPGDSSETVTHALSRVLSESTRMSVLVDDLLLLARLDAGRPLNREPVDMTRLAIEATSDARVARPGHRWMLELPDDPVQVRGDEHRLHQVLVNLLSNAGRHTPDGTTVTVAVSGELPPGEPGEGPDRGDTGADAPVLDRGDTGAGAPVLDRGDTGAGAPVLESVRHGTVPDGPLMVLTVTDDGAGIPASLLPDLFERFTRADSSRSHAMDAASTGLGLAIVDAVVAAHGGVVLVTSRPGMTRFTIALPRLTEPGPDAGERRPRPVRNLLNRSTPAS